MKSSEEPVFTPPLRRSWGAPGVFLFLWLFAVLGHAELAASKASPIQPLITNCAQLRLLTSAEAELGKPTRIEGQITFVDPRNKWLVLQDASGGLRLSPIPANQIFQLGQAVRVQGVTAGSRARYPTFPNLPDGRDSLACLRGPTNWTDHYVSRVLGYLHPPRDGLYTFWIASDDDAQLRLSTNQNPKEARVLCFVRGWTAPEAWDHSPNQKSEPVFLLRNQPCYIEVRHLDGDGGDHLAVAWQGPEFSREVLAGQSLSPWSPDSIPSPNTSPSAPTLNTGRITREYWTNIFVKNLDELEQSIPIPPSLADFEIELTGVDSIPPARPVTPGQPLTDRQDLFRAEIEGTVTFLAQTEDATRIELVQSNQTMLACLPPRKAPPQLLGAKVRLQGVCQSTLCPLGHSVAGLMWVSEWNDLNLLPPSLQESTFTSLGLTGTNVNWNVVPSGRVTKIRGRLESHEPGHQLRLRAGTNDLNVFSRQTDLLTPGQHLEAIGVLDRASGIPVLRHAGFQPVPDSVMATAQQSVLDQLTQAIQVKQLNRTEAAKAYPVILSGVITYNDTTAVFLQDATGGIYVRQPTGGPSSPLLPGTRVEVAGASDPGQFAPIVAARQITVIGPSLLPEAKRHSWIQMMSGKDDAQWLEVDGVVSEYDPNRLAQFTVRMEGGAVGVRINEGDSKDFQALLGARIRVRGVCQPIFDADGRIRGIRLQAPSLAQVAVVTPPLEDPFQVPERTLKSLGSFNMNSQFFEQLKVRGTVTYCHQGLVFLQDENEGLQATTATNVVLSPGDRIEVLGFPEMKSFHTVLVSARIKPLGFDEAPKPLMATEESINLGNSEMLLVQLEANFLGQRLLDHKRELDLQINQRLFRATLPHTSTPWKPIPAGTRLRLTGVCVTDRDPSSEFGRPPSSFELYLRDANDLVVLQLPSWWTIRRALTLGGSLVLLFLAALVWITQLRRQVDRQTRELKAEISERIRAEEEVARVHKELIETSRQAGMAEIATNVLHNVGNVLNSVNVSAELMLEKIGRSKAPNLRKVVRLLNEHAHDLPRFLSEDEKGVKLPSYLSLLADTLESEQKDLRAESANLRTNVDHIKSIVAMQQSYAGVAGLTEKVVLSELIDDALKMQANAFSRHSFQVVRDFEEVPPIETDKHKVMQILVNLLQNACYACGASDQPEKQVTIRLQSAQNDRLRIAVEDNGIGISAENLLKIFSHGFSARPGGHGFGLHYGANTAKELGGSLTASSHGPGQGAIFILELPLKPASTAPSDS
ncbi:MAG TPA: ATP-binding protein [Candidatus Paceibacterota bacterium]|nr:ATP-binding protein [Verrucomicrobiota bacterium]HRY48165.1 ATP-binding protein [Candidatus Paceibacterota bacterium]HSA00330.1 ATP-binding protein [Candidatus Paceibacterota bacterium]